MDLTKLTTPFALLNAETQNALENHIGQLEFCNAGTEWEWFPVAGKPLWCRSNVYRVKPAPPKPREFWLRFDMNGTLPVVYGTPTEPGTEDGFVVHVREVIE
jgi:hypothetical protein